MHSIGSLRADYPLSIQKVNTQLLTLNNLKKKENCVRSLRRTGTYLVNIFYHMDLLICLFFLRNAIAVIYQIIIK